MGNAMPRYDGGERRKNSSREPMFEWCRALEREWDADKRRRESHQSDAAVNVDAGRISAANDLGAPRNWTQCSRGFYMQ
jgi:hypothetical protein